MVSMEQTSRSGSRMDGEPASTYSASRVDDSTRLMVRLDALVAKQSEEAYRLEALHRRHVEQGVFLEDVDGVSRAPSRAGSSRAASRATVQVSRAVQPSKFASGSP